MHKSIRKIKHFIFLLKNKMFDLIFYKIAQMLNIKMLPPLPNWLVIEPNNTCNLNCITCPTGNKTLGRPPRLMSIEEFKSIVDQVYGYVGKIVLFNYGEPFLNKDIFKMIKYATRKKILVKVSTNGMVTNNKEICKKIIESGLQRLIICIDGLDDETINISRPGAKIKNILESFEYMRNAKRELKSKLPRVEMQYIVMKHNESQKEEIKKLAKKYNVDVFSEKTIGLDVREKNFDKMAKMLLPENESSSRYFRDENGKARLKGDVMNNCEIIKNSSVINSDGSVVPCCYDLFSEHVMGNVNNESLKSIWKGEKYKKFRVAVKSNRKFISMCGICPEGRVKASDKKCI